MSTKKDVLISIAAGFVILLLFTLVIWLPHHKRLSQAKAQLASVDAALQAELNKAATLTQINAKVNTMRQSLEQMDKQLVDNSQLAVLLRKLSAELRRLGIENQTIHTQSPVDFPKYTAIPLTLSFLGQYDQTDVFLRYMENLNYPMFISRLSMQRSPREAGKQISVNLRLTVFFAPEGESGS